MSHKHQDKQALVHLVNTYQKEKFQKFISNNNYNLYEAYGRFWIILELITASNNQLLPLDIVPNSLKKFVNNAIADELFYLENNCIYSKFIRRTLELRNAKREERAILISGLIQENKKLRDEVKRLQRIMKLRVKR